MGPKPAYNSTVTSYSPFPCRRRLLLRHRAHLHHHLLLEPAALRDGERGDRGSRRWIAGASAAERAAVPAGGFGRPRRHLDDLHGGQLFRFRFRHCC